MLLTIIIMTEIQLTYWKCYFLLNQIFQKNNEEIIFKKYIIKRT